MQHRITKEKIGITISPNLKREAEEIMAIEGIPTLSDFISQSVIVYIDRYKRERKDKAAASAATLREGVIIEHQ